MQSSCRDSAKGEQISVAGFDASKWHPAEVPGTVVGALVTDKSLPDPNYGMNLKSFPGFVSDTKGAVRHTRYALGQPVSLLVLVSH